MSGSWRRWLAGVLIGAALVGLALRMGDLQTYVSLLRRARPAWLVLAILLQLSTYVFLAMGWRAVLRKGEGGTFPIRQLLRIALGKLFADQALPTAGMGGNLFLIDRLIAIGASRGSSVAALLLSMRGYYAAYLLFALATLLLLWLHGQASPLMVGIVTTFVLIAIAIPALALWLRERGSQPLPPLVERVRPVAQLLETMAEAPATLVKDRALLVRITLLNAAIFAADSLTLYACLRGVGTHVAPATALIAFILSSIVVTLGPIPLGLGTFEAASTSVLHLLGVPIEAAVSATMLLRLMTLWLPLIPGSMQLRRMGAKAS